MIGAYVPASGVFVESISNAKIRDSFWSMLLGEKPGEKWKHSKASVRELEARPQWESLCCFCQPGSHGVRRGLTWSSTMAHRWI